jgi:signal transduction histidine kinase
MKPLGLRERLLLFYALMAITPVGLSGALLYVYLNSQVAHSAEQFQTSVKDDLQRSQRAIRNSAATTLRSSQRQMQQKITRHMDASREQMLQQQQRLLQKTVRTLQQTTKNALQQTERSTLQSLNQTLTQVERQVQSVQEQSLASLQETTARATRDALQQVIASHLTQLSAQVSRQVESLLRNYAAQLSLIAQQPAIQQGSERESRWILQALQDREPAYRYLALLDSTGAPLVEFGDPPDDVQQAQEAWRTLWAQVEQSREVALGEPRLYKVDGKPSPLVPMMAPVTQMGQAFRGAVCALVSLDEVSALTRTFRVGEQGVAMLVQRQGVIMAHPDSRQIGTVAPCARFLENAPMQAQLQVQVQASKDGDQLVAAAPVRRLQAWLLVVQPADEAFRLATELQASVQQNFAQQREATTRALRRTRDLAQAQVATQVQAEQQRVRQQIRHSERSALQQSERTLARLSEAQQRTLVGAVAESLRTVQNNLQENLTRQLTQAFEETSHSLAASADELRFSIDARLRDAFIVAMLCVLAFLLFSAVFLHRTLVRPLRALVKVTHEIAAGDLSKRVELPQRGCPDLDDLADSFNHMVDAVQQSQEELKRAEAQLIQSSKLASLGTLASGVAHELNQPLAIIRAIAQQNLDTLDQMTTPQLIHALREDLQIIHRQTVRMSQIIQHLRAFSRKPREVFEPVNLNEVAQNALILLREQLRQRGITLIENYAPDLPPVLGEANSLEQIVINLLTNARDALENHPDGQIAIETATYDDGKRVYAELRVRDNGPGVPEDIRPQIFDPFFTTKDPNKGTGLGLAISLEIAQKHHGFLLLGEAERGAEFILRVPVAESRQQAA